MNDEMRFWSCVRLPRVVEHHDHNGVPLDRFGKKGSPNASTNLKEQRKEERASIKEIDQRT